MSFFRKPSYYTPEGTVCPDCGEPCRIVALDNSFSYSGTHCTHGLGGVHYPAGWGSPVSSCCEADMQCDVVDEARWVGDDVEVDFFYRRYEEDGDGNPI